MPFFVAGGKEFLCTNTMKMQKRRWANLQMPLSQLAVSCGENIEVSQKSKKLVPQPDQTEDCCAAHFLTELPIHFALYTLIMCMPEPDNTTLRSCRQAATQFGKKKTTMLAFMPAFSFGFVDDVNDAPLLPDSRTAQLDTRSNRSMVRKEVFDTDKDALGPGAKVMKDKPFPIQLAVAESYACCNNCT